MADGPDPQAPALLVALVDGVARRDLCTEATPWLAERVAPHPVLQWCGEDLRAVFESVTPSADLRDLGLTVDQGSITLRSRGSSDASHFEHQPSPTEDFDLRMLWLRDPATAAARFGLGSPAYRSALVDLEGRLQRQLRAAQEAHRGPVELLLVGNLPFAPCNRSVDPLRLLRSRLGWRQRRRIEWRREPGRLWVRARDGEVLQACQKAFQCPPLTHHGELLDSAVARQRHQVDRFRGELLFVAAPGVAFGERPQRAAPSYHEVAGREAPMGMMLHTDPILSGVSGGSLPIAAMLEHYRSLMIDRAHALRSVVQAEPASVESLGAHCPDLMQLLGLDPEAEPRTASVGDGRR